jgi:hypothetical protein
MSRHEEYVQSWIPEEVARTDIGSVHVATVILRTGSMTRIAETMIFVNGESIPGLTDRQFERGPAGQARAQHDRWVAMVRRAGQA